MSPLPAKGTDASFPCSLCGAARLPSRPPRSRRDAGPKCIPTRDVGLLVGRGTEPGHPRLTDVPAGGHWAFFREAHVPIRGWKALL